MKIEHQTGIFTLKQIIEKVKSNLKSKGYHVALIHSEEEIRNYIRKNIPEKSTVCLGEFKNLSSIDIDTVLIDNGNRIFVYSDERYKKISSAYFISEVDAVTEDGNIVFIEKTKINQAYRFKKSEHVIVLVGINKITKDTDHALWRIKNIIIPQKSRAEKLGAPCEKPGFCISCNVKSSLCNEVNIFESKPENKITVLLLDFNLGF